MRLFLMALAFTLCASSAFALVARTPAEEKDAPVPAESPAFSCKPEGFMLTKTDSGLRLLGEMKVPTPGFTYDMTEEEPGPDGSLHATLRLKTPGGMVAQVISSVTVDYTFGGAGDRLHVNIDRDFNWGDASIDCAMTGMTQ
ncbi:MAG: hypothetical protein EPN97_15065 [Alphaproteobacteria bacterium]|nr:MAG: hypothetical protein EPN97_15065 [Alphaproteobacteria bacterium]